MRFFGRLVQEPYDPQREFLCIINYTNLIAFCIVHYTNTLQNYNKKMTYARTHVIFGEILLN